MALAAADPAFTEQTPIDQMPVLTVPTGVPPAPAAAAPADVSIETAISAALKAAGVAPSADAAAGAAPGAPEALPRPNPFAIPVATQATSPATTPLPTPDGSQPSVVLPLPGAQAADNVQINDDQEGTVSLVVREGSLRQVVAMIAQTQKLNIVFAGSTDTTVTAAFEHQPWQKVLDALLSASGHVARLELARSANSSAYPLQVTFELYYQSESNDKNEQRGAL